MSKSDCLGCKTHFEEGAKLPLEGICIELKNYPVPIKDHTHKFKLLRTICSFLNSKGGTIFIGAEDQTGEIKGVSIQRKQQDDFRIFIQQLTDRIQPKIDLSDREDILTQFVPIFNKGKFTGKHLVKILVKQGDPAELYCFSKKIQLQGAIDRKTDEYEIVCSFKRLNSGNIKQLKGYELVQQAKIKAAKPPPMHKCFHDDCNPEPLVISLDILKIGFSNIPERHTREILEQWFQVKLEQLGITTSNISYDQQNEMIVVEFEEKSEFTKAQGFVSKNIHELNRNLSGICSFEKKDKFLDCILYQNKENKPELKTETKKKTFIKKPKEETQNRKSQETKDESKEVQKQSKVVKIEQLEQQVIKKEKNEKQEIPQKKKYIKVQKPEKKEERHDEEPLKNIQEEKIIKKQKVEKATELTPQKQANNFSKKFSVTFTHINPKIKNQLRTFLDQLVKCKKNFQMYQNTVQVFLPNYDKFQDFYTELLELQESGGILNRFGFKNEIRFGVNVGWIDIHNYDKTKVKQLLGYLRGQMGKDLKEAEQNREGNRHFIRLGLSKSDACVWLDKLLMDKQIKTFQIPGAEKNQKAKMKMYLYCAHPDNNIEQLF